MSFPKLLILEEVAEILRLSVKSVRRRISSGKLKSVDEGGRVLVKETDLMHYLENLSGKGGRR